jgi:hypothetical protein
LSSKSKEVLLKERSEYRRSFARIATEFMGRVYYFILELHLSVSATSLRIVKDAAKIRGEMTDLNNSKPVPKHYAYTFQRAKNYQFYCPVFQLDELLFLTLR